MSKDQFHSSKKHDIAKKLVADLSRLDISSDSGTIEDEEMLSLIVEEVSQGIDISKRYPTFYKKLLNNSGLRQAFLDVLEALEEEQEALPIPWAEDAHADLSFLGDLPSSPVIEELSGKWRIIWKQSLGQLQAIFRPSELVYRSHLTLAEDPWFILLRGEAEVNEALYVISLECTFSEETQEALAPFLNLAISREAATKQPNFPIQVSLQWGGYDERLQITKEGRAKFPDIPLRVIFDQDIENVIAGLNLTIEPIL